jgi:hypothetical protein
MPSFEEYQVEQAAHRRNAGYGGDLLTCAKCQNTYFEQVVFNQYLENQPAILGQGLTPRFDQIPFILLRCACCGTMREPNITRGTRDHMNAVYDKFLDTMEQSKVK